MLQLTEWKKHFNKRFIFFLIANQQVKHVKGMAVPVNDDGGQYGNKHYNGDIFRLAWDWFYVAIKSHVWQYSTVRSLVQ